MMTNLLALATSRLAAISTTYPVFPADYLGDLPRPPFVKFELLVTKVSLLVDTYSVTGQLVFQVYTSAGSGPESPFMVAEYIEQQLSRTNNQGLTVYHGGFVPVDSDKSYNRHDLSLNLTYYGD